MSNNNNNSNNVKIMAYYKVCKDLNRLHEWP